MKLNTLHGVGIVSADFTLLTVKVSPEAWKCALQRVDFAAESSFARLHGALIEPRDLEDYLPNWSRLAWVRIPGNLLSQSESAATDRDFCVNVSDDSGAGRVHDEIVDAFLRFMAGRES